MTKSQIFKAAHKRAKQLHTNFGSYAKRLSIGLKATYRLIKKAKQDQSKAELIKANNERVMLNFLNDSPALIEANKQKMNLARIKCANAHNLPTNHIFNLRF